MVSVVNGAVVRKVDGAVISAVVRAVVPASQQEAGGSLVSSCSKDVFKATRELDTVCRCVEERGRVRE